MNSLTDLDNITLLQCIYAGVLFIFGLAMGSFLNVVACRTPLGISIISPPSACPACGSRIASHDNVPLLGWLLLGGKCRSCRVSIPVRYPLTELAAGILWGLAGWHMAPMNHGYYQNVWMGLLELAFVSAMIVTFLVDMDFQIILDEISLGGLAIALAASALLPPLHPAHELDLLTDLFPKAAAFIAGHPPWVYGLTASVLGALSGLAVAWFVYFLGSQLFYRQIQEAKQEDPEIDSALGLGDVKLMAFFGAALGWKAPPFIFLAASVLGSFFGTIMKLASGDPGEGHVFARLANRWRTGSSVIPFGPFLVAGALAFLFLGKDILHYFEDTFFAVFWYR